MLHLDEGGYSFLNCAPLMPSFRNADAFFSVVFRDAVQRGVYCSITVLVRTTRISSHVLKNVLGIRLKPIFRTRNSGVPPSEHFSRAAR